MRRARAQIEKSARVKGLDTITRDMVAAVVEDLLEDTSVLSAPGSGLKENPAEQAPPREAVSVELIDQGGYKWTPDAWARLERVPEGFMRDKTKGRMETAADGHNTTIVTLEIAEEGIEVARQAMEEAIRKQQAEEAVS